MTPREIRIAASVSEAAAARHLGICRATLRLYEADRECVKTPEKRWLLDQYYAGLQRFLDGFAPARKLVEDGAFDESAA